MQVITRQLPRHELGAYADHLLALDADDRRLRFGQAIHDAAIHGYVERIDAGRDTVFGVIDGDLELVGAAPLARGEH